MSEPRRGSDGNRLLGAIQAGALFRLSMLLLIDLVGIGLWTFIAFHPDATRGKTLLIGIPFFLASMVAGFFGLRTAGAANAETMRSGTRPRSAGSGLLALALALCLAGYLVPIYFLD